MSDCIFCDIIARTAPASVVYEDDIVLAIMDIGAVNPGHVLVIPKQHFALMGEMDEETGAYLFKVTMRLVQAVRRSGLRCEGVNLFLADGEAAFQEVPHVHMHVLPRFEGDPFKIDADWDVRPARDELDRNAARIRAALDPQQPDG
jgi:histidine triad (HIT) family protein